MMGLRRDDLAVAAQPTLHPVTQRMHTSKAAFREETRAAGCYEVGNDYNGMPAARPDADEPGRREAISQAYDEVVANS